MSGSLCATCARAGASCPVYPQNTAHCVEYVSRKVEGNKDAGSSYIHGCHSAHGHPAASPTTIERNGWHSDGRARMVARPATLWDYTGCCFARDGYAERDKACAGCAKNTQPA